MQLALPTSTGNNLEEIVESEDSSSYEDKTPVIIEEVAGEDSSDQEETK